MDMALRMLHIVFGMFWIGSDVFITFLLVPQLRALGPAIERPVLRALFRVVPPFLMTSSVITVVAGVLLMGRMKAWSVLFVSGWGMALFIGLVLTGVAMIVGFGIVPPITMRLEKLSRAIEGRTPTPDESRELDRLAQRVTVLARTNSVLLIIVVVAMVGARFL